MPQYFIKTATGEHGPIPENQVRALAANGRLQPTDQIRLDGNQQWRLAREIRGYVPPGSVVPYQPSPATADTSPTTSRRSNPALIGAGAAVASIVTGTVVWAVMFISRSAALPNMTAPLVQREDAPSNENQAGTSTIPAKSAPDPWQVQMDAQVAFDSGNLDLAERLFQSLTELEPANANHYISIGSVLLKRDDAGGAAAAFRSALRLDPNSAGALDGLGDALLAAKDIRGAVGSWELASALRPQDATVGMKLLSVYTLAANWDKAVPLAEGLAEQNRKLRDSPINRQIKTSSLTMLASVYIGAGRIGDAEAVYLEILLLDASHTGSLVGLAGIAFEKCDVATARTMLGRIELPTADSLFLLCRVEALSGNNSAAIRAAEESLAKDPKQPERWFLLAVLESEADRPSDAIAAVDKAIEGDGGNPKFRVHRARLLLSAKRFQETLDEADRAKAAGAGTAEVQVIRGESLIGMGRTVEGVAALRLSISEGTASLGAGSASEATISASLAALALVQLFSEQKKWVDVAEAYGALEKLSPDDSNEWKEGRALAHRREAAARYERGDIAGHLDQLRLAIEASSSAANKAALVNALAIRSLTLMQDHQNDAAREVIREIAQVDQSEAAKLTRLIEESEKLEGQGEELRRRREEPPPATPSALTRGNVKSTIKSKFTGKVFDHGNLFEFQNKQIWKQTEYYIYYHYAYGPSVLVYRDGAVWKMKVEGIDHAVTVERLK